MSDEYYTSPIFQASQPKRAPYTKNPTFFNSVSASWQLEPVGQVGRHLWYGDPTYLDLPYDPPENIQEQIQGYEQYYDSFTDIRNQEHLTYVKEKIDYHNHLRQVRDVGGLMPEIVAAFADPINYTPIVWVKGVSLAQRFIRGGGIIGGLTAATEPIRHAYDPTATQEQYHQQHRNNVNSNTGTTSTATQEQHQQQHRNNVNSNTETTSRVRTR